jgi:hypothetical protein
MLFLLRLGGGLFPVREKIGSANAIKFVHQLPDSLVSGHIAGEYRA